jgi:hypothetical protein
MPIAGFSIQSPQKMSVSSKAFYLSRLKLYEKEKPYMFTFHVPETVGQQTNHLYESFDVDFHDARPIMDSFSLNIHGFQFCKWDTGLISSEFDDVTIVQTKYYEEIVRYMYELLPGAHKIHVLTHLVLSSMSMSLHK